MPIKKPELKRCPFCGGEAQTKSNILVTPIIDENGAYVDADTSYWEWTGRPICEIGFDLAEDEPEGTTIAKWNRRCDDAEVH